jgi:sulfate transport system substrate-binding protein
MKKFLALFGIVFCLMLTLAVPPAGAQNAITLLNVSYDPTRELYQEVNRAFSDFWKAKTGDLVTIDQSNGGSGKQARAVMDGLKADVVTLALAGDIDALHDHGGLVASNWQTRLPDNSTPYTSTMVFLVRKGNPKGIKDWNDLVKPGLGIITPNPKTSGGARWIYLAAYGYVLKNSHGDTNAATRFVGQFYGNVKVLGTGARDSTTSFIQNGLGDVLVNWENEALLVMSSPGRENYQIIYPSLSILAEPPVAVVDKVVDQRGTRAIAEAYLNFLWTPAGQEIAASHFFRPRLPEVARRHEKTFPKIETFTIADVFGGWARAQKIHFDEGGVFDQIFQNRR